MFPTFAQNGPGFQLLLITVCGPDHLLRVYLGSSGRVINLVYSKLGECKDMGPKLTQSGTNHPNSGRSNDLSTF